MKKITNWFQKEHKIKVGNLNDKNKIYLVTDNFTLTLYMICLIIILITFVGTFKYE